jgi:hypothetical protein
MAVKLGEQRDRNGHPMPKQDRDFWIALSLWGAAVVTVFGYGLYAFIERNYWYGSIFTIAGLGGITYLTAHLKGRRLSPKVGAMALMLVITWGLIGYQVWYLPRQSVAPQLTLDWLTPDRKNVFKSGALSIINASGNMPSTRTEIVAEAESGKFASALADLFIFSGVAVQTGSRGNRIVGLPTHRLDPGLAIVAPVPSLAAEAVRVGFERIGIQTRRSIDPSRSGDYLIVEVGPAS